MRTQFSLEDPWLSQEINVSPGPLTLSSPAFKNGGVMPREYSGDSLEKSPPLLIGGMPVGAKSLVLIMDERGTPHGIFTHWILFNLDMRTRYLPEGLTPLSAQLGSNSFGEPFYRGPQAYLGEHLYFFRLYALNQRLELPDGASRGLVENAMREHVITEAVLLSRFALEGTQCQAA